MLAATERLATAKTPEKGSLNLEVRRNIYESNGKEATPSKDEKANGESTGANGTTDAKSLEESLKEPPTQYHCLECGADCSRVRYHLTKSTAGQGKAAASAKYDVCPTCFLEGRFPSHMKATEFTRLENEDYMALPDRKRPWTDAETLLLLEGLELFDEDWNAIAEHVGNKRSREDCVLKFLQLEIEDPYLEADPSADKFEAGLAPLNYLTGGRVPFSQADNPIMSVMGFLAGLAEPNVTAAAAGRAVDEMRKSLRQKIDKLPAGDGSEKGKEKETAASSTPPPASDDAKNEDSMDVDTAVEASSGAVATVDASAKAPAASIPFALGAARASALASHQEREITRLVSFAVNTQLSKLELKLQQFNELESLLSAERRDLERRRQQLFLDRLSFQKRVHGLDESLKRSINPGAAPEETLRQIQEAMTSFGLGGAGEKMGVQRQSVDDGAVKPPNGDTPGFRTQEI